MDSSSVGSTGDRKRTFAERLVGSGVVTFLIGPEKRDFIIHKNFLLDKIPHFWKSCSSQGGFSESTTGTIELPEISVNMFSVLSDWIYGAGLPDIPGPETDPSTYTEQSSLQANQSVSTTQAQMVMRAVKNEKLYFEIMYYAEMWESEQLKSACFGSILKYYLCYGRALQYSLAIEATKGVPSGSPFRKWILRVIAAQLIQRGSDKTVAVLEALRKDNDDVPKLDGEIMEAMVAWVNSNKTCDFCNQKIFGTKNVFASNDDDDVEVVPVQVVSLPNAGGRGGSNPSRGRVNRGGRAGK